MAAPPVVVIRPADLGTCVSTMMGCGTSARGDLTELACLIAAELVRLLELPPHGGEALIDAREVARRHGIDRAWVYAHADELRPSTQYSYEWALRLHLLPFFARHRLSEITIAEVDRYRSFKVRQAQITARSINQTITRLAQILEYAVEYEYIARNPARGRRRRLKAPTAPRPWLDRADHITVLLDAASELDREARADRKALARRATLAALTFSGLRIGELCALRWRDVDLASGRITVRASKTDAGMRRVDLLPALRDELATHKAAAPDIGPDVLVFSSGTGGRRDKDTIRNRVLNPAIERANENLTNRGDLPLPERLTLHGLRHTFASLLVALGEDPRYVMGQLGHTDPAFTLRLYTHTMRREDDERARLQALVDGVDWAPAGTSLEDRAATRHREPAPQEAENPAGAGLSTSAPGRIRTCGLLLRRQALYPLSYGRGSRPDRPATRRMLPVRCEAICPGHPYGAPGRWDALVRQPRSRAPA